MSDSGAKWTVGRLEEAVVYVGYGMPMGICSRIVTSHLAGATFDNFSVIVARAAANAKAVLRSDALQETDLAVAPGRKVPVA